MNIDILFQVSNKLKTAWLEFVPAEDDDRFCELEESMQDLFMEQPFAKKVTLVQHEDECLLWKLVANAESRPEFDEACKWLHDKMIELDAPFERTRQW